MCTEGWHCHLHQPSSNLIDLIAGWGKRLHEWLEGRMERLLPSPDVSPLGCAMVPKWWAYSALDWSTRCPIKVQVEPEQVCTCQRSLVFGCYVPKPHLNLSLLPALLFIFSTVSMYSPFTFIHSFRIYIYIENCLLSSLPWGVSCPFGGRDITQPITQKYNYYLFTFSIIIY